MLPAACELTAAPLFDSPLQLATGDAPGFALLADINGDEQLDILIANSDSNDLSVYLGDGQALRASATLAAGPEPDSVAAGDFDGDGDIDLAIANHNTRFISLLNNDGSGHFSAGPDSPLVVDVDPHPHIVISIDVDNDGRLDLLVDDRNGQGYGLLRGLGNGRFETGIALINAGGDPYLGVAHADLNGDGRPDFVAPLPRHVAVIISEGQGYQAPVLLPGGAFAVALADVIGDSSPDLIRADESAPVEVWKGRGDGRFELAWQASTSPGAKRIATGDFNADGHGDFVLQNYASSQLLIALGDSSEFTTVSLAAGEHPWGLAVGDLDGDGRDDLVSLDQGRNSAYVFLSK